jgi:hypothetical protein
MALTAQQPRVGNGDLWRFAVSDRLRNARFEETRRVIEVVTEKVVCDLSSTDPAFAAGRAEYTREWNLLSRPASTVPGDEPDEDNRWRWTPAYPQFRFPLAPGRQWQGAGDGREPRHRHAQRAPVPLARPGRGAVDGACRNLRSAARALRVHRGER